MSEEKKVYDQETLDTLLESARAKATEAAQTELQSEIDDLKTKLAEKETALEEADTKLKEAEEKIEEAEEEARLTKLADERAKTVKDAADFDDEKIEERKMAWAALEEEDFNQLVEDFKAARESAGEKKKKTEEKPPKGKVDPVRETAGEEGTDIERVRSNMSELLGVGGGS